jgi:hypothetical protein
LNEFSRIVGKTLSRIFSWLPNAHEGKISSLFLHLQYNMCGRREKNIIKKNNMYEKLNISVRKEKLCVLLINLIQHVRLMAFSRRYNKLIIESCIYSPIVMMSITSSCWLMGKWVKNLFLSSFLKKNFHTKNNREKNEWSPSGGRLWEIFNYLTDAARWWWKMRGKLLTLKR